MDESAANHHGYAIVKGPAPREALRGEQLRLKTIDRQFQHQGAFSAMNPNAGQPGNSRRGQRRPTFQLPHTASR